MSNVEPTFIVEPQDISRRNTRVAGPSIKAKTHRVEHAQTAGIVWLLIMLALATPIPLGSHHPVAWLLFATMTGAIGFVHFIQSKQSIMPKGAAFGLSSILGVMAFVAFLQALMTFVPVAGSIAPRDTMIASLRLAAVALFVIVLSNSISQLPDARKVASQIASVCILTISFFAIVALATEGPPDGPLDGLRGPFANRNSFATFLGLGLVLGLASCLRGPETSHTKPAFAMRNAINWLAVLVISTALICTQSRMGIVSAGLGLLTVVCLSFRQISIRGLVIALVTLGILGSWLGSGLVARISMLSIDWQTRSEFYAQIWQLVQQRPLLGHGADSFALAFEAVHHPPVTSEFIWDRSHSTYLKLLSEMGLLVGTLVVLSGLILGATKLRDAVIHQDKLTISLCGGLVLVATHSAFDFSLEILANQILFCTMIVLSDFTSRARTHEVTQ